ncbi:MAG: cyclic nucleotide-binding domain-containing protein [Chloroflexi bacterium]|nr:cyclic nucleotide-binding domain-containing protein [Chloroflexota bacterium]
MYNQVDIATAINSIPWFFNLSQGSINRLCSIASVVSFQSGHVIFNEGEQHPNFYIILIGKVRLESYIPGRGLMPLFTAEALDVVGWSSLTPVVRQTTCTAIVESTTNLLRFNAKALTACCEEDCDLGFVIMRRLTNIVASRLLAHRLNLLEIISCHK